MNDSALEPAADLVVTAVLARDETFYPAREQKLVKAHYTVTLQVEAMEKGRRVLPAEMLQFTAERNVAEPRFWFGGLLLPGPDCGDISLAWF